MCPGCAVSVIENGETIYNYIAGYAGIENNVAINEFTNFRLASVTKQFMAVSILILLERKLIALEDTFLQFFPDFPLYGKDITIYQLLTHTSGLKDYEDLIPKESTNQVHDEDIIELLKSQDNTLFQPGIAYSYSNGGYCLLRLIIEKVSQQTIDAFLEENVFTPLGMDMTMVNYEGKTVIPNRAYGYSYEDGKPKKTDQDKTSATIGDGGIYSSIKDLQTWDQVLYTDKILSRESRDLLLTKHVLTDEDEETYYGFGLFLKNHNGKNIAYHGGSSIGFKNATYYVIDDKRTVVFLSNRNGGDASGTAEKIADLLFREQLHKNKVHETRRGTILKYKKRTLRDLSAFGSKTRPPATKL